jgi:hypothetical protein
VHLALHFWAKLSALEQIRIDESPKASHQSGEFSLTYTNLQKV